MAGMLPGVECARRRRLYSNTTNTNGVEGCSYSSTKHIHNDNSTTRHSFSLYYPTNFESLMLSSLPPSVSQKEKRNVLKHEYLDDDMGGAAREAKQKLDDKFRERRSPKRKRPFWWFLVAYVPCKHQNTSSIFVQPNH
ncbi:hypothetical protein PIB30_023992 [Stylosanthes scabra]|uniref:Uncharacterized protein n=1 Tax=Stylosanthes scabra TaxID=79078 RepID=A0ABU6YA31_9FABA|nr:hypothetical protein [Stylosanthes scabra]